MLRALRQVWGNKSPVNKTASSRRPPVVFSESCVVQTKKKERNVSQDKRPGGRACILKVELLNAKTAYRKTQL